MKNWNLEFSEPEAIFDELQTERDLNTKLTAQLNWILKRVGINEDGVYLANANSKLDRDLSINKLIKHAERESN